MGEKSLGHALYIFNVQVIIITLPSIATFLRHLTWNGFNPSILIIGIYHLR